MPLTNPDAASEVADRIIADVELALAPFGGKPALKNSWLLALMVAFGNRVFDFYLSLDRAALEALPDTAIENMERWAAIWGVTRTPGEPAAGFVAATGVVGSSIPAGSILATGDGKRYVVGIDEVVAQFSGVSVSITRSGSTATAVFGSPHGLAPNVPVTFSGATQPEYNVASAAITLVSDLAVSYQVSGAPATPATGTPVAAYAFASVLVQSEDADADANQDAGAALQLESPLAGVDDVMMVQWDTIEGGANRETDESLRARLLERIQNPIAHFNAAEITAVAKAVPGVTRVFVQEITPNVGEVTIYFMRDDDPEGPIPSGAEIAEVDAAVQAIRPANSDAADVHVLAPTSVPVDFNFSALSPNTATMKAAIEANLVELFAERTDIGEDLLEDAYRSAIFNTVDTETGQQVATFTLSTPSGDVAIAAGEIATLGNVTFA